MNEANHKSPPSLQGSEIFEINFIYDLQGRLEKCSNLQEEAIVETRVHFKIGFQTNFKATQELKRLENRIASNRELYSHSKNSNIFNLIFSD